MVWARRAARHHGYTGQRGYHPLLAVAKGTGEVLMCRLRKGRANTARGAANFLRETVSRVRYAGATGPLTMRADSGFYTHDMVAACRDQKVRYSITVRQHPSLRNLIEAIPEDDWTPISYWMEGGADVAETSYTPFASEPDAVPVRLIVPAGETHARLPTGPACQLQLSRLHHRPGGRHPVSGRPTIAATPRSRTPSATSNTAWVSTTCHRDVFPPTPPWLAVQVIAHNLARWTTRIGLGEQLATTKTLRRRFFSLAGRLTPQSPPPRPASATGLALAKPIQQRPGTIARPATPILTPPSAFHLSTMTHHAWPNRARLGS